MIFFKGFRHRVDAVRYMRRKGFGQLCWLDRLPRSVQLSTCGQMYLDAVEHGGLDPRRYPFCVRWTDRDISRWGIGTLRRSLFR